MPNVKVTIAGDPSYGSTVTRTDGRFDVVVNGGRSYTVRFEKPEHLPSDRQVYVGWEETSVVKDVILVPLAPTATTVTFGAAGASTFQVATGTKSADFGGISHWQANGSQGRQGGNQWSFQGKFEPAADRVHHRRERSRSHAGSAPASVRVHLRSRAFADEAPAANNVDVQFSAPVFYGRGELHLEHGRVVSTGWLNRALWLLRS